MTFKTYLETDHCTPLSGFGVVEVEGRDASAFLQSQTMNDVAGLVPGRWHWNGLLTAKGRVTALFALARIAESRFLLVLPDMPADALAGHLQRFVFRSKVSFNTNPGRVAAAGPVASSGDPSALAGDLAQGFALDLSAEDGPRWLWLVSPSHPALASSDAATDARWRSADIAHGFPRLSETGREAFTPHMLSLERLGAFSLKKGCYPGQEIVARTHYLGQSKRSLQRLASDTPIVDGSPVLGSSQREWGRVASVAQDGPRWVCLAVLPSDLPDGETLHSGGLLTALPLLDGLAR